MLPPLDLIVERPVQFDEHADDDRLSDVHKRQGTLRLAKESCGAIILKADQTTQLLRRCRCRPYELLEIGRAQAARLRVGERQINPTTADEISAHVAADV